MTVTNTANREFKGRIGRTLVVFFILLAVLPIAIIVPLVIRQANQQAREQATNQLESVAEVKTNEINRLLSSSQEVLQLVLADPRQYPRIVSAAETEDARLAPIAQVSEYLTEKLVVQEAFTELYVYNLAGEVRASTQEDVVGQLVNELSYFEHSVEGQNTHAPYYDENGNINIIVTEALQNEDGNIIGVIAGRIDVVELGDIMTTRVGLGETGETYLVSAENNYLVTPSRSQDVVLTQPYNSTGIEQALSQKDGSGVYENYLGEQVIGVYRWIPDLESAMLSEIEEAEALTVLRETRNLSLLAGLFAAALAVVIGIALTFWLTTPITELTQVAATVTQGNYTQQAPVTRNNEIGQLADAFNKMTRKLIDSIDDLNKKNEDLRVATQQAQDALKVKDEFLAVMSHELRTPLNAIIGFTGIMTMDGRLDARDLIMTQRIEANSHRLLALINDVLDISKIEAGQLELASLPISPNDIARRLQAQMGVLAEQKGVGFNVTVDSSVPPIVMLDEDAFIKITTNLLSNAFKFTEQGAVSLHMSKQDNNLVIQVKDTGIGIPAHKHDVIFDSFRQADSSSTRKYGGTGLGLAITRRLATAMEGTIRVESVVGQGSTFTVTLPLEVEPEKVMEPQ